MSTHLFCITGVLLASVLLLHAEDAVPLKKSATVPPYELQKRSTFTVPAEAARAPFWPIGWVKRQAGAPVQSQAVAAVPKVTLDEKSFRVTSILLGTGTTPSLAVINGRAYSEGEFLRMPKGGAIPPLKVRVQRINDGHVILQNADQILVASLLRPELSTKRADETLLDPDR